MSAVRQSFERNYVEAHAVHLPSRASLREISNGAHELALLAPSDGAERSAEIGTGSLPHFDDCEHVALEAHQIDLAGFAAQVALEHDETARLQVVRRELLGGEAASQLWRLRGRVRVVGWHGSKIAQPDG